MQLQGSNVKKPYIYRCPTSKVWVCIWKGSYEEVYFGFGNTPKEAYYNNLKNK